MKYSDIVKGDDSKPGILWHGTFGQISEFLPFTHFGTEKAAEDRIENARTARENTDNKENKIPVYLAFKKLLVLEDSPTHNPDSIAHIINVSMHKIFPDVEINEHYREHPIIKKFEEEADKIFCQYQPQTVSPAQMLEELKMGGIFTKNQIETIKRTDPAYFNKDDLKDYAGLTGQTYGGKDGGEEAVEQEFKGLINNAHAIEEAWKMQKIIFLLEKYGGYDGIVYENRTEDKGSQSYIVFKPHEQVIAVDSNLGRQIAREGEKSRATVAPGSSRFT